MGVEQQQVVLRNRIGGILLVFLDLREPRGLRNLAVGSNNGDKTHWFRNIIESLVAILHHKVLRPLNFEALRNFSKVEIVL